MAAPRIVLFWATALVVCACLIKTDGKKVVSFFKAMEEIEGNDQTKTDGAARQQFLIPKIGKFDENDGDEEVSIGYNSMKEGDSIPCDPRDKGNCKEEEPARPYGRGCSSTEGCRH